MNSIPHVLVADDCDKMRCAIAKLLASHFHVIGDVNDGEQLVLSAMRLRPDVIVTDVCMPGLSGPNALKRLWSLGHQIPYVLVSAHCGDGPAWIAAGAAAFVSKLDLSKALIPAVQAALAGKRDSSPASPPAFAGAPLQGSA